MTILIRQFRSLVFLIGALLVQAVSADYSSGTGFFITTDGYVVTNYHVIGNAHEIFVYDSNKKEYRADVVLTDKTNDLAVIKIGGNNHSALPIGKSNKAGKGDSVFTVGFPNIELQGLESKVTQGIISSLSGIFGDPNSFQITVPVQPGNSGGALIDSTGAVVGIVNAKLDAAAAIKLGAGIPENVNYAIKSSYLLELLRNRYEISHKLLPDKGVINLLPALAKNADKATVLVLVIESDNSFVQKKGQSPAPATPENVAVPRVSALQIEAQSYTPESAAVMEAPPVLLPGNIQPTYPAAAVFSRLKGKAVVRVQVLASGAVGEAFIRQSSGAQVLDQAALDTVRRWRFRPSHRNGEPVPAWVNVPIEYRNPS